MMIIRNFLTVCTMALLFSFVLASCQKESTELPSPTTQNANPGNQNPTGRSMEDDFDDLDSLCFSFVYPITVELPDGELQTANSNSELELIFENYYTANPNSDEDPMLVFPITVIDGETGEEITLEDEDEFFFMLEMCFDYEWEECFTINYPVTVIFPDGATLEVNSDEAIEAAFDDWYAANPNSDEDPTLEFPINVTDENGEIFPVADMDELEALFDECFDDDWEEPGFDICFDLVFPITIEFPDGSTAEANDYDELDEIYIDWFENNPNATDFPTLAFPISVELEDGEVVEVNSEEELEELFEECEEFDDDWNECFSFNYPITIVFPDGSSAAVNSDEELIDVVEAWYVANPNSDEDPSLQYPVDVTTADGEVVTINNEEEFDELFEECFECFVANANELATGTGQSTMAAAVVKQHAKLQAAKEKRVAKKFAQE